MLRLACVAIGISTVSACTVPRTALVVGAATTIAGVAMIASIEPPPPHSCEGATVICPPDIGGSVQSVANGFGYLLGGMLTAVGLGITTSGAIGLGQEHDPEPPPPLPTQPTGLALGPHNTLQIRAQAAARSGRCDIAIAAAHQLQQLDAAMYADLIAHDAPVERCLAWGSR